MNFEDVRVGQILVDRDGNQFEVMEIDRMDDDLPVCLKLVKHVNAFAVPGNEFSVTCADVESLELFVGEPKTVVEVIENVKHASLKASDPRMQGDSNHDRNFKQSKAYAEAEELEDIVHDMFVLPTPEEMRQLVIQHQIDDISQVIRDAAKRGETSVNLPEDQVDGVAGALMAAGYQVYFTKHPQCCIISW